MGQGGHFAAGIASFKLDLFFRFLGKPALYSSSATSALMQTGKVAKDKAGGALHRAGSRLELNSWKTWVTSFPNTFRPEPGLSVKSTAFEPSVNPFPFLRSSWMKSWSWAVLCGKPPISRKLSVCNSTLIDKHFSCLMRSLFLWMNKSTDLCYQSSSLSSRSSYWFYIGLILHRISTGHHKPASVHCDNQHNGLAFAWRMMLLPDKLNLLLDGYSKSLV